MIPVRLVEDMEHQKPDPVPYCLTQAKDIVHTDVASYPSSFACRLGLGLPFLVPASQIPPNGVTVRK